VDAVASLPADSCIIDGEAIVVDQSGFGLLRYRRMTTPLYSPKNWAALLFLDLFPCYGRPKKERRQAATGIGAIAPATINLEKIP
jgi:ATP-dependent DNA ligase